MTGRIVTLVAVTISVLALVGCGGDYPTSTPVPSRSSETTEPRPAEATAMPTNRPPTATPPRAIATEAMMAPTGTPVPEAMYAEYSVDYREVAADLPAGQFSSGGTTTVNDEPYDLTFFQHYGVNPFIDTEDDHLSTFAMDVDTASYSVARRFVEDGNLPDPDSVRVEEFINYFEQGYEPPEDGAFAISLEGSPSRFGGDNHWMLRVGIQGKTIEADDRQDVTLIFAIDVSGSMDLENRLGLVKRSLRLLVDELRPADEVGIVVYGSNARVVLQPTDGGEKRVIMQAIDSLYASGSTYVEDGLRKAYEMAAEQVQAGRITRVLLLSDGVGNVGRTGADAILREIQPHVDKGVSLTTVGFGMGNFNDVLMERLANDGDGSYHYVDTLAEARRVFVDDLVGTLQDIARDAKIQLEFNPEVVRSYRLLGYENRDVADEDFRNDEVDAGEVGAGHSVTALYEMKLHDGVEGNLGTVYVRYEDPDTGVVSEVSRELLRSALHPDFQDATTTYQLSAVVAEYAELLRGSYWAREGSLSEVSSEAKRLRDMLSDDADVTEFAALAVQAEAIKARNDALDRR
ncbi:MAG: von Willebrand factor type A domain-containing protein [Chloroflexota bacterium]|nr:von Willebrand factor type A domain-containing protein [Chloroflexota bacterium]MDE2941608.1 von Willebrand factor type A domain-containing protein [Chloroflexota bacterium]MDE3267227.1 von Willebrand factor type A domain-containing protein [Chloroflexota bacterium]